MKPDMVWQQTRRITRCCRQTHSLTLLFHKTPSDENLWWLSRGRDHVWDVKRVQGTSRMLRHWQWKWKLMSEQRLPRMSCFLTIVLTWNCKSKVGEDREWEEKERNEEVDVRTMKSPLSNRTCTHALILSLSHTRTHTHKHFCQHSSYPPATHSCWHTPRWKTTPVDQHGDC